MKLLSLAARLPAAVGALAALALLGCSSEVGIHVSITLEVENWSPTRPFDHISVNVAQGDYRATACLYPLTSVPNALVIDDPAPHACADHAQDLSLHAVDDTLSPTSWGFDEGDRSVNFELPSEATAFVSVEAGFGGKTGVFEGSSEVSPSGDYSTVPIVLSSEEDSFLGLPGCNIRLSTADGRVRCAAPIMAPCLFPGPNVVLGHTTGFLPVNAGTCRMFNEADEIQCTNGNEKFVAAVGAFSSGVQTKALVQIRGRFAACADEGDRREDCRRTTQCNVPPTNFHLTIGPKNPTPAPMGTGYSMACLPTSTTPISFSFRIKAFTNEPNVSVLAQAPIQAEDVASSCFFDVLDIEVAPVAP